MAIASASVKLKTGWTSTKFEGEGILKVANKIGIHRILIGVGLREQGVTRLCAEGGSDPDLTEDIYDILETCEADYVTDILLETDAQGKYQGILLGSVELASNMTEKKFHIIDLCSLGGGAGVRMIQKVKDQIKKSSDIKSITLESLHGAVGYYEKLGFKYIDKGKNTMMMWRPEYEGSATGGRRKTRRRRLPRNL